MLNSLHAEVVERLEDFHNKPRKAFRKKAVQGRVIAVRREELLHYINDRRKIFFPVSEQRFTTALDELLNWGVVVLYRSDQKWLQLSPDWSARRHAAAKSRKSIMAHLEQISSVTSLAEDSDQPLQKERALKKRETDWVKYHSHMGEVLGRFEARLRELLNDRPEIGCDLIDNHLRVWLKPEFFLRRTLMVTARGSAVDFRPDELDEFTRQLGALVEGLDNFQIKSAGLDGYVRRYRATVKTMLPFEKEVK